MHTPIHRDLCAELAAAVRHEGFRIGWYFSPMDWRDPDFRRERSAAFVGRKQGELRGLLSNYSRNALLWFDWDYREPVYDQVGTYALVKRLKPDIIIGNRLDLRRGDNDRMTKSPLTDYYSREQHIGAYDDLRPCETCMTLGRQWSRKPNDQIKSSAEVLAIVAPPILGHHNTIFEGINKLISCVVPPITTVFLLGVFWKRPSSQAAFITLIGGMLQVACVVIMVVAPFIFPAQLKAEAKELVWEHWTEPLRAKCGSGLSDYRVMSVVVLMVFACLYYIFR